MPALARSEPEAPGDRELRLEGTRRRTFAIISHPDAGKTTLTEKLLLYGGAIGEAGAVTARRGRRAATSDWMALERERGISVSSTVLRFEHDGLVLNLLDTPGHRDFSEDTYRVLSAADSAIMLLDAAKGIEEQTLKLFEVARARRIPLLTFVNKLDRPSRAPLELLDEIERTLQISAVPLTWPVGMGHDFEGVVDRRSGAFLTVDRTSGGATAVTETLADARVFLAGDVPHRQAAAEELELLDAVGARLDLDAFLAGTSTPVFFGSALSNFGVRLLLDAIAELAPAPFARAALDGDVRPTSSPFSAFVFKVQANLDPRHRDRLAFVRVCSGRFEAGMKVTNARTGRPLTLSYAHELFGRDRLSVVDAYPGDIVGLVNATDLRIGDTLYVGQPVSFPPPPTLAPEHFVVARNRDSSRYKRFRLGLTQLDHEGVVQVLRLPEAGDQAPILAGVGPMQFEVAVYRLEHEFGAPVSTEATPYSVARRTDDDGEEQLRGVGGVRVARREDGTLLALFHSELYLRRIAADHPNVVL
ncbi:MAG TPA: peptide chain release factor 3, partial [Gaiellaceae bacterium]|nr:peptide chain release factor 3 [Gaiellaceae bacterium]